MKKVMFICHGNICRSPMAEFILKELAKRNNITDIVIKSSAATTEEIGSDMYPPSKKILKEKGIPFAPRKARLFTREEYGDYDYIIVMDEDNVRGVNRICGQDPEGKIHKLLEYAGEDRDIADPWYTRDFEKAYQDINKGCEALIDILK